MRSLMFGAKALLLLAGVACAPVLAQSVAQPPIAAPQVLGSAERQSVVETMATAYEARYASAEGGARIATRLRQRMAAGAYDGFTNPTDFAAAITADLRAAVQDNHLRAVYEPNRAASAGGGMRMVRAPGGTGPANLPTVDPRSTAQIARSNYGFDRVERLRGNVGYLKLSQFVPLAISADTATAAMNFLSNSDAMIVDLRGLPGGSPDLVARLISYFTGPQPVQLMATHHRATNTSDEIRSEAAVPGRRMTGKPLYVLIDGNTASAGEMFAYFTQRQKLGTLVGATTSGAGIGGNMVPAGSGITFFLPQMQITDGPGWERTGVAPDVKTRPEQALQVAHAAAVQRLVQEANDPALKRERVWMLELVEATARGAVSGPPLSTYAGQFGTRTFSVESDQLVATPQYGRREALTRVAPDVFRSERMRYAFERDASGKAVGVSMETIDGTTNRATRI